jgi:eukaryotic-like serine/threonine-protein kinase
VTTRAREFDFVVLESDRLDPEASHHVAADRARLLVLIGRREEARVALARATASNRSRTFFFPEARISAWTSDRARIRALLEHVEGPDVGTRDFIHPRLVGLLRGFDEPAQAIAAAQEYLEDARDAGTPAGMRAALLELAAECFLVAGKDGEALAALEEAAAMPYLNLLWLDGCPLLEPLRDDARFAGLRAAVAARVSDVWS